MDSNSHHSGLLDSISEHSTLTTKSQLLGQPLRIKPRFNLPRIDTTGPASVESSNWTATTTAVASSTSNWIPTSTPRPAVEAISTPVALTPRDFYFSPLKKRFHLPLSPIRCSSPRVPHIQILHGGTPELAAPPLTARKISFLLERSNLISIILENALHRVLKHAVSSPSCQPTTFSGTPTLPLFQSQAKITKPIEQSLSIFRKSVIVICSVFIILLSILSALLVSKGAFSRRQDAQHVIMGSSILVILLASAMMYAARRSIKEILAMAAVAVTVCQCIMSDVSSLL
jgi:hypothetical protein